MSKSNTGQTGEDSIRIGGKEVHELSVVDQMRARKGIKLTAKQQAIKDVKAEFPQYQVAGLDAAIRAAKANIVRFEKCIKEEQATIAEYTGYLALCKQRDEKLAKLEALKD